MISRRLITTNLCLSLLLSACGRQADGDDIAASGAKGGGLGGAPSSGGMGVFGKGGDANGGAIHQSGGTQSDGGAPVSSGGRMTNTAGGSITHMGGSPAVSSGGASAGTTSEGGASAGVGAAGHASDGSGGRPMASGGAPTGGTSSASAARVIGYFAQWGIYQRGYRVKNIADSGSAERLDVINYAFGNVVDGQCIMVSRAGVGDAFADYQKSFTAEESVDQTADTWDQKLKGNFNQLKKLKANYPKLKVLISIGGWTWSKGFSDAALTAESRSRVVKSCIDMYIRGDLPMLDGDPAGGPGAAAGVFDGIDIDWEYPAYAGDTGSVYREEDTQNFTLLLAEFRRQLSAIDPKLLLTIAAPAGKPQADKLELGAIHQHLDWINLMTYDMHGAWDASGPTNFHAPLFASTDDPTARSDAPVSADATVSQYLQAGVPPAKLSLGVPFYGRGWTSVASENHGLYQTASGPAPGTYEAGIEDYRVLAARGAPGFRDERAGAYWTFDGTQFWSFDDAENIRRKTEYVRAKGLGGVMVWSLDGDTADGELIRAVAAGASKP